MFLKTFAPSCLEVFFQILHKYSTGTAEIPPKVLKFAFEFMHAAQVFSALYNLMKPHLNTIVFPSVFKCFSITEEELELWSSDPASYVSRSSEAFEDHFDPKLGASELLNDLVRVRTRDTLAPVLSFIEQILNHPDSSTDFIRKDAALSVLGQLNALLITKPSFKGALEHVLVHSVIPDLQAPSGILRARACWMISRFYEFDFSSASCFAAIVEGLVRCLNDTELPVVLEAALALGFCLRRDEFCTLIRPYTPMMVSRLFALVDKVDCEAAIDPLDILIAKFSDEMIPQAEQICRGCVAVFQRNFKLPPAGSSADDDYEDLTEEAFCLALQSVKSIVSIMHAVSSVPEIYPVLETIVVPVFEFGLSRDGFELMEDVLEIMTIITYHLQSASDLMWRLLGKLIFALEHFAGDFVMNILPVLDNFISKEGTKLSQFSDEHGNYFLRILNVGLKWISADVGRSITEPKFALKLFETILVHHKGAINEIIPQLFLTVFNKFREIHLREDIPLSLKMLFAHIISLVAYYDSLLFVQICEQNRMTKDVINVWLTYANEMNPNLQKAAILGISSILLIPSSFLPSIISDSLQQILIQELEILEKIRVRAGLEEEVDEDEGDARAMTHSYDPSEFLDIPDDQDFVDDQEEQAIRELEQYIAGADELDENWSDDEEADFESPLDDVDPFVFFANCMKSFSHQNKDHFERIRRSLSPGQSQCLQTQMEWALHRENMAKVKHP